MKRIIFLFIFTGLCLFAKSQERLDINYTEIGQAIAAPDSIYYYPLLMQRYQALDTTLTLKEYAYIYYGFSFQENYPEATFADTVLTAVLAENDFNKLYRTCDSILKINPLSLGANSMMGYALYKLGRPEEEFSGYQRRYNMILKAISLSGDGFTEQTAFKVIFASDERDFMFAFLGITTIHSQYFTNSFCDHYTIDPSNEYRKPDIYFDMSRNVLRMKDLYQN